MIRYDVFFANVKAVHLLEWTEPNLEPTVRHLALICCPVMRPEL